MEKGHKRVRDHIADIHIAQLELRKAMGNLRMAEMELVKTLIDKHDPALLKPNYTLLNRIVHNEPDF